MERFDDILLFCLVVLFVIVMPLVPLLSYWDIWT